MTHCEICNEDCSNDINEMITCSNCGHGKFHLILTRYEKKALESFLNEYDNVTKNYNGFIKTMLERLSNGVNPNT